MPSADQVPTNNSHSRMLWHKWVVLIAGSTGSALRADRPPNFHITPVVRRDLVYRASATGSLYRSPLTIMAFSWHGPAWSAEPTQGSKHASSRPDGAASYRLLRWSSETRGCRVLLHS